MTLFVMFMASFGFAFGVSAYIRTCIQQNQIEALRKRIEERKYE